MISRVSFIGFGVHFIHVGGPDVSAEVHKSLSEITQALYVSCNRRYSAVLDRFEIDVFVDGKITFWGLDGHREVKYFQKQKYIRGSIFISKDGWQGQTIEGMRKRLFQDVSALADAFIEHLQRAGVMVNADALKRDLATVKERLSEERVRDISEP